MCAWFRSERLGVLLDLVRFGGGEEGEGGGEGDFGGWAAFGFVEADDEPAAAPAGA